MLYQQILNLVVVVLYGWQKTILGLSHYDAIQTIVVRRDASLRQP